MRHAFRQSARLCSQWQPTTQATHFFSSLAHGPSKPNLAHLDVQYIFNSFLRLDHPTAKHDTKYAPRLAVDGEEHEFSMSRNDNNEVLAHCPNAKTYNLSSALAHANLNYFILDDSAHDKKILKRCLTSLGKKQVHITRHLRKYQRETNSALPIHLLELYAIQRYTSDLFHKEMNRLLHGKPMQIPYIDKFFIMAMLAISGTNKNISARKRSRYTHIKRYEQQRAGLFHHQLLAGKVVHLTGLNSFTECNELHRGGYKDRSNRFYINGSFVQHNSIKSICSFMGEEEVLLPPTHLTLIKERTEGNKQHIYVQPLHGRATEGIDSYAIECAWQQLADHTADSATLPTLENINHTSIDDNLEQYEHRLQPLDLTISKIIGLYTSVTSDIDPQSISHLFGQFLTETLGLQQSDSSFYQNTLDFTLGLIDCTPALPMRLAQRQALLQESITIPSQQDTLRIR